MERSVHLGGRLKKSLALSEEASPTQNSGEGSEGANLGDFSTNSQSVFAEQNEEEKLTPEEIQAIRVGVKEEQPKEEAKYTPKTQPRDARGKYRKVLARLKNDLGVAGLNRVVKKVEEAENLVFAGDYAKSAKASADLINIIDRLDTKALNPESIENVREGSRELGKVIANLPFAFGKEAEKIRYSDVPPEMRKLIEDMIKRVEQKIGKEDADIATEGLKKFMSGSDLYNQSEISGQMSKLLRLLT